MLMQGMLWIIHQHSLNLYLAPAHIYLCSEYFSSSLLSDEIISKENRISHELWVRIRVATWTFPENQTQKLLEFLKKMSGNRWTILKLLKWKSLTRKIGSENVWKQLKSDNTWWLWNDVSWGSLLACISVPARGLQVVKLTELSLP